MGKMLLALALAMVLVVELLYHMTIAATPTNMKDLQITTNLPCSMVILLCSLGGKPRCIVTSWEWMMSEEGVGDLKLDEEGVGDLKLDEEGAALDRKVHPAEQKKLYKKHHTIRGILVAALPHKEYLKMSEKSTAKAMFTSLCSLYEGDKKVREAKSERLILN